MKTTEDTIKDMNMISDEIDSISCDLSNLSWRVNNILEELNSKKQNNQILDLENFKYRLLMENLYSKQLDNFIEHYIKYNNGG